LYCKHCDPTPPGHLHGEEAARERGTGSSGKVPGSRFWYIWYYKDGEKVRESSKSTPKQKAVALLDRRRGEVAARPAPAGNTMFR